MRKMTAPELLMTDNLLAAVVGAIAGYFIARHCPQIAWIVHALVG
jgi:hypothetical protein